MYGNVDYVPSPPEEASLKRSPSEHSSIYLQEESIYEPVRSSEKPDSENLWRLSSLGSSAEDTTLRWNQGPPLRNNAWIPSYQRHYYAMETELKTVKEQHRYITMGSFLLYNEDHKKCAEVRSSSSSRSVFELTASVCSSVSYSQRFQWLPGGRLMSSGEGLCVGVEGRPQSLQPLKLYPCDTDKTLSWQCSNETLLGVKGEKVFFNYGNNSKYLVILYWGTGVWSRWRARTLDGKILDGGACA
ncbi:uncharacterized protein LOC130367872 isoform X2 [Hyla sarda]|uniref:uncharacterized protein LOC130367872 isoform X2 n=1 Tax=Hyla sarda TaxID=327740 RepID=UPI0024C4668F|nr:uncharacterized protein LOC130367872 isoform X2 [Hyla sarda]